MTVDKGRLCKVIRRLIKIRTELQLEGVDGISVVLQESRCRNAASIAGKPMQVHGDGV